MKQTPNQTSQGWFLENSGYLPFGLSSPGTKETPSRKHSLLFKPTTHTTGTGHLFTALVNPVGGSSLPVQSCCLPMQSCHMDDPDLVFFLRATCHTASGGDHGYTRPDRFLTGPI